MANVIQDGGPFKPQAKGVIPKAKPTQVPPNALLNPGQPLSGNALLQAAQQLANTQTQGPLAELAKQIAAQNNQTAGTMKLAGGYYGQLGNQAQQGVTDEQGIASGLNQQLQDIAGRTNSQLQGLGQNATQSLLSHSPQGDGGLSAPALASLTSEIARQQGLAAQQQGASQAFGANQGANYSGLAATGLSTNALAGTQALKSIAQSGTVKNEPLLAKVADLKAQQGSLVAANEGKLRQQEINNRIAEQGLGLKAQDINAVNARTAATIAGQNQRNQASINAANRRSQAAISGQNQRSQETIAAANSRDAADRASREAIASANRIAAANRKSGGRGGGGGALTPHENNAILGSLDKVQNAITTWQRDGFKDKTGKVVNPHPTNAQMRQVLGSSYPSYLVQAAFELLGWGHITPGTAAALHQRGIRGGTFRGKPIVVAAAPGPRTPTVNPGAPGAGDLQGAGF